MCFLWERGSSVGVDSLFNFRDFLHVQEPVKNTEGKGKTAKKHNSSCNMPDVQCTLHERRIIDEPPACKSLIELSPFRINIRLGQRSAAPERPFTRTGEVGERWGGGRELLNTD